MSSRSNAVVSVDFGCHSHRGPRHGPPTAVLRLWPNVSHYICNPSLCATSQLDTGIAYICVTLGQGGDATVSGEFGDRPCRSSRSMYDVSCRE